MNSTSAASNSSGFSTIGKWPAPSMIRNSAPGIRSAIARASSTGTVASSAPCRTSVGTVIVGSSSVESGRLASPSSARTIVSGSISGETQTLPLFVAKEFEQFRIEGAYAGAIVLALMALLTLLLMSIGGRRRDQQAKENT